MAEKAFYKELRKLNINGTQQWISLRGNSPDKPILLFLHGGPGGSEMATAYTHYGKSELEKKFVVVNWDQRGSGKSYNKKIPANTMTVEQLVNDGLELTKMLLKEFGKAKIYLVGHSWGSLLGIKMITKAPELFYSYIGISQLVHMSVSEQRSLAISIELAQKHKNERAVSELQALKSFDPGKENYLRYMAVHRTWLAKLGGLYYSGKGIHPSMLFIGALFSPEYNLLDVVRLKKGLLFSVEKLWAEIMTINLLNEKLSFDIPLYFIYGKADNLSHPQLIETYYNRIRSPKKKLIEFEFSGHSPQLDEWEKYEKTVLRLLL